MGHHRFDPAKAARLDSDQRLARQPPRAVIDALAPEAGDVVLDLGAGTGTYAIPLARRLGELGGGRVIAADVEPAMLDMLRERAGREGVDHIEYLALTGAPPYPIDARSLDGAMLVHVFHELDDMDATAAALRDALRPGGTLLVVDWDPDHVGEAGPPADHRVPLSRVQAILAAAGFESTEVLDLFPEDFYVVRAR